jgi:hypothetical protein
MGTDGGVLAGVVTAVGQEGGGASGAKSDAARGSSSGAEAGPAGGGEQGASSVEQEALSVRWRVDLRSAVPVERVEIVVNGEVVHEEAGLDAPGTRVLEGTVELPAGGWVAARARGGDSGWPLMAAEPFAHSSPVWIGSRGSMDPLAAARSQRSSSEPWTWRRPVSALATREWRSPVFRPTSTRLARGWRGWRGRGGGRGDGRGVRWRREVAAFQVKSEEVGGAECTGCNARTRAVRVDIPASPVR